MFMWPIAFHLAIMSLVYYWLHRRPADSYRPPSAFASYFFLAMATLAGVNAVCVLFFDSFSTLITTLFVALISSILAVAFAYITAKEKKIQLMYCCFGFGYMNFMLFAILFTAFLHAVNATFTK